MSTLCLTEVSARPNLPCHGDGTRLIGDFDRVWPNELQAEHWFELELAEGRTVLRHTIEGCAVGKYESIWSQRIEPLHDRVLEALLANVAAAAAFGD